MSIMTSYFGSKAPDERRVCIARRCPKGWACRPAYPGFAPLKPWAAGDWRARYRAELLARYPRAEDLARALDDVRALAPNPILCCYERSPDECHRRVLAEMVMERLGIEVPEWEPARQLTFL